MNKVFSKKTKTIINFTKTITNKKYGKIFCYETYTNNVLTSQKFKIKSIVHNGFEPKNMYFQYFGEDFSIIDEKIKHYNGDYNSMAEVKFILNLEEFESFDKLYCLWFDMDGNAYKLTNKDPLKNIFTFNLWGSDYDLHKCKQSLLKIKDVSNIRIEKNIPVNYEISGYYILYFSIELSPNKINKYLSYDNRTNNSKIAKDLGLLKFKLT
jgi:hypothetical protein